MGDLKIDGIGSFSGGIFETVKVNGVATISSDVSAATFNNDGVLTLKGNLDCKKLDCDGVLTVQGNAGGEEIDIDGVITVGGFLHCNGLTCDGTATIDRDLKAQSIKVDGIMTVKDGLQAAAFNCDGTVTVNGDMRCETFNASGLVTIKGRKFEGTQIRGDGCLSATSAQISADVVDFDGRIRADEIVGDSVTIRSRHKILALFTFKKFASEARLIEATNVNLRGVKANEVNGQHIYLTEDCVIDRIDCSGTLHIDSTCRIGQITGEYQMV